MFSDDEAGYRHGNIATGRNMKRATDRAVARGFGLLIAIMVAIRLISCYGQVMPRLSKPLVAEGGGLSGLPLTDDGRTVLFESALSGVALIVVVIAGLLLRRYLRQLKRDERVLRESEDFAVHR